MPILRVDRTSLPVSGASDRSRPLPSTQAPSERLGSVGERCVADLGLLVNVTGVRHVTSLRARRSTTPRSRFSYRRTNSTVPSRRLRFTRTRIVRSKVGTSWRHAEGSKAITSDNFPSAMIPACPLATRALPPQGFRPVSQKPDPSLRISSRGNARAASLTRVTSSSTASRFSSGPGATKYLMFSAQQAQTD